MEQNIQVLPAESLSLIIKAEIDTQIATAKAYPRSIKAFVDKAMSMATLNENVAASCNYSLPRAGKSLDGPSVRLAEIACASYGNIRSGARVISNDGKKITAQGICHDLETNNCVTVEVERRITDKHGKTFSEDMQIVTGNAACAIAFRNAVFKVIPFAMVQEVYDAAKEVAMGTAETLPARRQKAIDYFVKLGIKEPQICEALDVKRVEDIDLEKLFTLRGMATMIKNGESTIETLFPLKAEPVDKASERITLMIKDAKTVKELKALEPKLKNEHVDLFQQRMTELSSPQGQAPSSNTAGGNGSK